MARRFGEKSGGEGGTHERPWVYFMIDSFFLVTQFFVLTFQLRVANDLVLPNKLIGTGGIICPPPERFAKMPVGITVLQSAADAAPKYQMNGGELLDEPGVVARLNDMVSGTSPERFSVRVSYEGKVVFKGVMTIFNACKKLGIQECGLMPSRVTSRV